MLSGTRQTLEELAAAYVLGIADLHAVPSIAANWLAAGFDGNAVRQLAGYSERDVDQIEEVLPVALEELGQTLPLTIDALIRLSPERRPSVPLELDTRVARIIDREENPVLAEALNAAENDLACLGKRPTLAPIVEGLNFFVGLEDGRHHGAAIAPSVLKTRLAICSVAAAAQETLNGVLGIFLPWCERHGQMAIIDCAQVPGVWQCNAGVGHILGEVGRL